MGRGYQLQDPNFKFDASITIVVDDDIDLDTTELFEFLYPKAINKIHTAFVYESDRFHPLLHKDVCGKVFSYLGLKDLVKCSSICKLWNMTASQFYQNAFNNDLFQFDFIRETTTPLKTKIIDYDLPVQIHFSVVDQENYMADFQPDSHKNSRRKRLIRSDNDHNGVVVFFSKPYNKSSDQIMNFCHNKNNRTVFVAEKKVRDTYKEMENDFSSGIGNLVADILRADRSLSRKGIFVETVLHKVKRRSGMVYWCITFFSFILLSLALIIFASVCTANDTCDLAVTIGLLVPFILTLIVSSLCCILLSCFWMTSSFNFGATRGNWIKPSAYRMSDYAGCC